MIEASTDSMRIAAANSTLPNTGQSLHMGAHTGPHFRTADKNQDNHLDAAEFTAVTEKVLQP
jgi:hypothetical protein